VDRVFLDANVLFSAAYGSPGLTRLWAMAAVGGVELLSSGYAVSEAWRNLDLPEQRERLERLLSVVTVVPEPDTTVPCPVDLPPKDRPVLLAAIQAGATHLLTGDLAHFGPYRGHTVGGVLICTPRDYLMSPGLPK
jgi:predicted nucleic acid-binding protein